MEQTKDIGEKVKKIRELLRLNQKEFGEELCVSGEYISELEKGNDMPSDLFIAFMLHKFSISEVWFRKGTGPVFLPSMNRIVMGEYANKELTDILIFQRAIQEIDLEITSLLMDSAKGPKLEERALVRDFRHHKNMDVLSRYVSIKLRNHPEIRYDDEKRKQIDETIKKLRTLLNEEED